MDDLLRGFFSEMGKFASTRQVREMRNLFHAGNFEGLESLAGRLAHSGVLKETPAGTTLRKGVGELGGGAEGLVTPVIGGTGAEARKHFYQEGEGPIASRAFWKQKAQAGRDLRGVPGIVPFLAEHEQGREVLHRYKYIPDMVGPSPNPAIDRLKQIRELPTAQKEEARNVAQRSLFQHAQAERTARQAQLRPALDAARDRGWVLQDVEKNMGNSKPTTSGPTILDYLPVRAEQVAVDDVRKGYFLKSNPNPGYDAMARQNYHSGMGPFFPEGYHIDNILKGEDPRPAALTMAKRLGPSSRQLPKPLATSVPALHNMLQMQQGIKG